MIDLSKHIQEGARLELEALELSTDECSFMSAQNSAQAMQIDELKRDLAAAQEARQRAEALAEQNAKDAERYRWLKSETANPEMGHSRVHIALDAYTEEVGHKGDELDAAIDAAIGGNK